MTAVKYKNGRFVANDTQYVRTTNYDLFGKKTKSNNKYIALNVDENHDRTQQRIQPTLQVTTQGLFQTGMYLCCALMNFLPELFAIIGGYHPNAFDDNVLINKPFD
eukprot:444294_1